MPNSTPKALAEELGIEHEGVAVMTLKERLVREVSARLEKLGVKNGATVEFGAGTSLKHAGKCFTVSDATLKWKTDRGLRIELDGRDYDPMPLLRGQARVVGE